MMMKKMKGKHSENKKTKTKPKAKEIMQEKEKVNQEMKREGGRERES